MRTLAILFLLGVSWPIVSVVATITHLQESILQGQVCDLFGRPIRGAIVQIFDESLVKAAELQTDDDGKYKTAKLKPGSYIIRVVYAGFYKEDIKLTLKAKEQKIANFGLIAGDLPVSLSTELAGSVNLANGKSAEYANVTIVNPFNQKLRLEVTTDSSGKFNVWIDYPGQYVIFVSALQHISGITTIIIPASVPRRKVTVEFSLKPLG